MHAHIGLTFAGSKKPSFRCAELGPNDLQVDYFSQHHGLGPMVVGLLKGLGDFFGNTVEVQFADSRTLGAGDDRFLVITRPPETMQPDFVIDSAELLNSAFPFYFALDKELRFFQWGASLAKLHPSLQVGDSLRDHFKIERPALLISYEELCRSVDSLFIVNLLGSDLRLRA